MSMMSGDKNLGNIDLEDSQTGLPGDAFLPSSAEGSFRSSMNESSYHNQNNDQQEQAGLTQNRAKKSKKKKVKTAVGKVNYSSPTTSEAAANHR